MAWTVVHAEQRAVVSTYYGTDEAEARRVRQAT